MRAAPVLIALAVASVPLGWTLLAQEQPTPFAPSALTTASGEVADPDAYYEAEVCGQCHVAQYEAWKGSVHSRSHVDELYLAFADRAREEGGDELYRFCSGCHAPGAVATGEIPGASAKDQTFLTHEGVTCDVCHQVSRVRILHAGGGANGSVVLEEGEVRYGPIEDPIDTPAHESAYSATHREATFCSACHTLTHPHNGVVIENTYAEWKESPYAKAGIRCQDCHMRTVEQAMEVARTMKPLTVEGESVEGQTRPNTYAHLFTGGNTNRDLVGMGELNQKEARARLQSAATISVDADWSDDGSARVVVSVTNVGAGHAIPTSITELRHVWIDLAVTDATGAEVFRSGKVDENGKLDTAAVTYTAVLHDADGKVTYLPWRAVRIASENLIGPKQTRRETYDVTLPPEATAPYSVRAVLRYRSAPQDVLDELFGKGKLTVETVDMASAATELVR